MGETQNNEPSFLIKAWRGGTSFSCWMRGRCIWCGRYASRWGATRCYACHDFDPMTEEDHDRLARKMLYHFGQLETAPPEYFTYEELAVALNEGTVLTAKSFQMFFDARSERAGFRSADVYSAIHRRNGAGRRKQADVIYIVVAEDKVGSDDHMNEQLAMLVAQDGGTEPDRIEPSEGTGLRRGGL